MNHYTQVAFTICSNNYLGQALALKKSFLDTFISFFIENFTIFIQIIKNVVNRILNIKF